MEVHLDGFLIQNESYDYPDYYYKEEPVPKDVDVVLIPVVYSLVVVVGLLGNALLMAVVVKKWRYSRISDIFVFHLGVADILLLLTLPFWVVQAAHNSGWCFGTVICKICGAVFNINFYCGMFLLLCICLDCYRSIVYSSPLYSQNKPVLAHASCLLIWLMSVLLTLPDWMFLVAMKDSTQTKTLCVHRYVKSERLYSRLVNLIVRLLLPAATLIFCFSHILIWLKRSSKDLWKQKVVMVFLPLVVVFFLCWMPYNISDIIDTYRNHSTEPLYNFSEGSQKTALMVTSALACLHACLRPLLYVCLCGNFRKLVLAKRICNTAEKSLWELGVGEEAMSEHNNTKEEQKEMTIIENQMQTV
ncbi:C-X-C chemokine receptor type 3 [Channa argus]|uniref:C-X-C chemokine receptor type 3 n=1 Tax=Channa argus TaxID=215402 RepID=A0A6G1PQ72_CHAAH|nr:C-X-C chemokine receptor type 3 [Channa argus]KAK2910033.1 hypothetical protein Q8A73_007748 [Channa argus]